MAKTWSLIVGLVLLALGIAGYVMGGSEVFGFGTNPTHNLAHVIAGIVGLAAGWEGSRAARLYCLSFGALFAIVTILGFLNVAQAVELLNLNMADNILHLVLAVIALGAGFATKAYSRFC